MTIQKEKKQIIDTYNKSSKYFKNLFEKHGINKKEIEFTYSKLTKKNPKTIELGCGTGKDANYILNFTNDYLGLDFSKNLISIARAKNPDANFIVTDFIKFHYPKNIDVVFAFASLLHSDRITLKNILSEIHNKMNVNGIFFISLIYGKYERKVYTIEGVGTRTFYFYTLGEIEKILPDGFITIYKKIRSVRGKKWFDIILMKTK